HRSRWCRLLSRGWLGLYSGSRHWVARGRPDCPLARGGFGLFNASKNSFDDLFGVMEPFGRPYSMNPPAHTLKNMLAKQITISDGEVDTVAAGSHLRIDNETPADQCGPNGVLKIVRLCIGSDRHCGRQFAVAFGELKKLSKRDRPSVVGVNAGKGGSRETGHE